MRKEIYLLVFFLLSAFIAFGCSTPEAVQAPETAVEDVPQETVEKPVQEARPAEETMEIEESTPPKPAEQPIAEEKPKAIVEDKKEFQIFDPVLTYEGAYNGPLYGTSEQVGSASMDSYFENLDRNGINFFIGMFGISGEPNADTLVSDQGLGEVIDAAQKHPYRIIPFFNPGIGGEDVEKYLGETLTGMYRNTLEASQQIAGKGFIMGFGEVETQEWSARHNDPMVLDLVSMAQENDINFMFHPVAGKIADVEAMIEAYPDTIFLIHMYREDLAKSRDTLIKMLKEHNNLYFSMDAAHIIHINGDVIYDFDSRNKQSSIDRFVSYYDSNEKSMINNAIKAYKPLADAAPDKVMWGTEIGPEYAFDQEVFDRAVRISRFVIAGFDEEDKEAVGYKNALRVFGQGAVADAGIRVIDTRSWTDCTNAQMSSCDDSCDTPDGDVLTPEQEACVEKCRIGQQCREVVEMDVG
ncbi:amidohydrolase family protein [Candidatus Woesearchaeota archaeon]|nr:amidohydrolase family protein [Candidatus Woesearchaeota archaeon]